MLSDLRPRAALTVDLEDYRQQYLRDYVGGDQPPYPNEVFDQVMRMLEFFEEHHVRATFFTVGKLAEELPASVWDEITRHHRLGCHGFEHRYVSGFTPEQFYEDIRRAKEALEEASGDEVISYRAPYFSADGCGDWYFETLARAEFALDSSVRHSKLPEATIESYEIETKYGRVREVPLASLGISQKRVTVIGGTYFRLFPLKTSRYLIEQARELKFLPMLYLHPYDIDATAKPIQYPFSKLLPIAADRMRRTGRKRSLEKLKTLFLEYRFESLEDCVGMGSRSSLPNLAKSSELYEGTT